MVMVSEQQKGALKWRAMHTTASKMDLQ